MSDILGCSNDFCKGFQGCRDSRVLPDGLRKKRVFLVYPGIVTVVRVVGVVCEGCRGCRGTGSPSSL